VKERHLNLGFGVAALVASVLVGWQASLLRPSPYDPLGPGAFPKLISILLGALSIILIARVLLGYDVGASDTSLISGLTEDEGRTHRKRPLLALGLLLAVVVYTVVLTLTPVGFLWATIVFLAVSGFAMSARRPRDAAIAVAVAGVVALSVHFLFTRVLVAVLP
jgi:putative tricarboxylic transport membrane protein